jgi:hypothetical protein
VPKIRRERERAELTALESGRHICRRVTAALQKEMFDSLSSHVKPDFASACAPVIVYSLQKHVLDVEIRKKLAFKFVHARNSFACEHVT